MGLKPSRVLRRAIEEAIREEEVKKLKERIEACKAALARIPVEDIVRSIREDREAG
ncbi:MAG: DUF4145 domain-containing protein [Candidatus Bathyarchaeia archaeon]